MPLQTSPGAKNSSTSSSKEVKVCRPPDGRQVCYNSKCLKGPTANRPNNRACTMGKQHACWKYVPCPPSADLLIWPNILGSITPEPAAAAAGSATSCLAVAIGAGRYAALVLGQVSRHGLPPLLLHTCASGGPFRKACSSCARLSVPTAPWKSPASNCFISAQGLAALHVRCKVRVRQCMFASPGGRLCQAGR